MANSKNLTVISKLIGIHTEMECFINTNDKIVISIEYEDDVYPNIFVFEDEDDIDCFISELKLLKKQLQIK